MHKILAILLVGLASSGVAVAERNVRFTGDFETGQIQAKSSTHDGFYVHTLANPQSGSQSVSSGSFGPSSGLDTRVVRSEVVGGETVMPRKGSFFLRSAVYFDKNYLELNDGQSNKARSKLYLSDTAHRVEHDEEGYVGFSIYTPKNFEPELGVKDRRGSVMLYVINSSASRTHLALSQWVQSPSSEAHWFLFYNVNAGSTDEGGATEKVFDLGPVSADAGKWTDFVIRYRFNPFAVATNPAVAGIPSSLSKTYQGNKGILQVWKASGPVDSSGNRNMTLLLDKVNVPIGLVPHATEKLVHRWRIYKYGWHNNPTSVDGPVWFGFDEIRQGSVVRDGTAYADVSPSGLGPSGASNLTDPVPEPPTNIVIR